MRFFKLNIILLFSLLHISFSCGKILEEKSESKENRLEEEKCESKENRLEEEKSESKENGLGDAAVGSITSKSCVTIPTILKRSDLEKPSDLNEISFDDLLDFLNYSLEIYVDKDEMEEPEWEKAEWKEFFKCYFKDHVTDGQNGYWLSSGRGNANSCLNPEGDQPADLTNVNFVGCKGVDFSENNSDYRSYIYNKKIFTEQSCTQGEEFYQVIMTEQTVEFADSEGETCKITIENGAKTYEEKCIFKRITNYTDANKRYYEIAYLAGLKVPASGTSDQWFNNGQVNVVFNNWTVTLTYTDSSTPPSYSATNGNVTETGSLDDF